MKVNLVGAVGGGNFGDEFILNCCIDEYNKINGIKLSVSGFSSGTILKDKKSIEPECLNFFDVLNELRHDCLNGSVITLDKITSKFNNLEVYDVIHFIGGGYINALWPSNYALLAIAYIYSKKNKIPIYATGLGLYPYIEDINLISLFNSIDLVDVRDKKSKEFIPNASYTGDDALLAFKKPEKLLSNDETASLIISLQSHLFEGKELIERIFTKEIYSALHRKKIRKIIILEAAPEDNISFSREIYNEASENGIDVQFVSNNELLKNGLPYNKKSFVISSRYHINLVYSMLDIGGIAVFQNEYYKNKHQSITDMGGEWPILSHKKLGEILDHCLPLSLDKNVSSVKMESIADAKRELFANIIANTPTKNRESISLEGALAIIKKYIIQ